MGTYSTTMRMTGLSGFDTETMVQTMMKAESMKYTKLDKTKQTLTWKQDAYRSVADSLKAFQSSYLNMTTATLNFRSESNYNSTTSKVSANGKEDTGIKVKAGTSATLGTHRIEVTHLAKADKYESTASLASTMTGSTVNYGQIAADVAAANAAVPPPNTLPPNTKMYDMQVSLDGGVSKTLTFDYGEMSNLSSNIVTGTNITTGSVTGTFNTKDEYLAALVQYKIDRALGTDDYISTGTHKVTVGVADGKISFTANNGHTLEVLDQSNAAIFGFTTGNKLSTKFTGSELLQSMFAPTIVDSSGNVTTQGDFDINGKMTININNQIFTFDKTDTFDKVMKDINSSSAGVNFKYDNLSGKFTMEAKNQGSGGIINFSEYIDTATNTGSKFFQKLGFAGSNGLPDSTAHTITGQDAILTLDGITISRESNKFVVDDVSYDISDAKESTTTDLIVYDITLNRDTAKTTDTIKQFVEQYNKLLDVLVKAVSTQRQKAGTYSYYEPLTSEEKEGLSEKEIERLETAAKTGILYNDPTLQKVAREMRTMMGQSVTLSDGSKLSLSQIGVLPSDNWKEGGKLKIDDAKLQKALEEKGDKIMELFTKSSDVSITDKANRNTRIQTEGIAERLNDLMEMTASSTGTISAVAGLKDTYSETHNTLFSELSRIDSRLIEMQRKLKNKEDNYYSMFSRMEAAMNNANQQMASIQSMMG